MEDLGALYEIYSGEGITDYMEGLYENYDDEVEFTKKYIQNMYKFYEYGMWLVCRKDNDEIVGRAGIENREVDGENKLELGYLISVKYQRRHFAYEICQGILSYAKDYLLADEMVCFVSHGNVASEGLAEKLGFCVECEDSVDGEGNHYTYYIKKL